MPGGYKRRKYHQGITTEKKKYRTKRRTRDLDQIAGDLDCPVKRARLLDAPLDQDLPGCGQFYCIHCAKHFISDNALAEHCRGKVHKKRVKELETEVPYTIKESEAAAGFGSYQQPKRVKENSEELQISESEMKSCEPSPV